MGPSYTVPRKKGTRSRVNPMGLPSVSGCSVTSRIAFMTCRFPMYPLGHIVSDTSSTVSFSAGSVPVEPDACRRPAAAPAPTPAAAATVVPAALASSARGMLRTCCASRAVCTQRRASIIVLVGTRMCTLLQRRGTRQRRSFYNCSNNRLRGLRDRDTALGGGLVHSTAAVPLVPLVQLRAWPCTHRGV